MSVEQANNDNWQGCEATYLHKINADINVSQGSVATYAWCGGAFNIPLATNLPRNFPVKKFF